MTTILICSIVWLYLVGLFLMWLLIIDAPKGGLWGKVLFVVSWPLSPILFWILKAFGWIK